MKTVVVLRHAQRQDRSDNSSHLSQAGITQARQAGKGFERFDLVVTSPLPRAVETAVGMGFAVSRTHPGIQDIGEPVLTNVQWNDGYGAWAEACRAIPLVRSYVDYVTSLVHGWVGEVSEGGSLLLVTHGGIVEAIGAGLCPDYGWPARSSAGYAEGFAAEIHGVRPPALTVLENRGATAW